MFLVIVGDDEVITTTPTYHGEHSSSPSLESIAITDRKAEEIAPVLREAKEKNLKLLLGDNASDFTVGIKCCEFVNL